VVMPVKDVFAPFGPGSGESAVGALSPVPPAIEAAGTATKSVASTEQR
jgi:hypothetical protein